jgi:hypothetical protein
LPHQNPLVHRYKTINRPFRQVVEEYLAEQQRCADIAEISAGLASIATPAPAQLPCLILRWLRLLPPHGAFILR